MKTFLIAGVAALGFALAGPNSAEAGGCYRGYPGFYGGVGYGPSIGLGYGYAAPAVVPVRHQRQFYRGVVGPVPRRGIYGVPGRYGYPGFYGRSRSGVVLSTPGFGIRFGF